jgi:hypothetical protein
MRLPFKGRICECTGKQKIEHERNTLSRRSGEDWQKKHEIIHRDRSRVDKKSGE